MIEEIILKTKTKSFNQLMVKDNNDYKNIRVNLKDCFIPFGLEEYNEKYVLNFEIGKNKEFNDLILKLEKEINNLLENNFSIKSVLNKRDKYDILCKSHIIKNRNKIITKFIKDKNDISIFSLEKGKSYNLELEISGIWIYKNNAGYYINIINIRE